MSQSNLTSALTVSLTIGLCLLGYGIYMFLSQWDYSEVGHEYLFAAYAICSVFVFLLLRMSKIGGAIFFIVCLFMIVFYSNQKFEWRKNYIDSAQSGKTLPVDQYMEDYPTYEQHKFAWIFNEPRWLDFSKECYEPFLEGPFSEASKNIGRNCKSLSSIKDHYNIDIRSAINSHYRKMQSTAKRLEKGKFKNKILFEQCIASKKCAMIPLLPAGAENVTQQSEDYMDIRKQFWSLINDKKISVANCNFFDLCRIAISTELVDINKL